MDEMTMLRQTGTLLDPSTAEPRDALRRRVLAELQAEAGPAREAVSTAPSGDAAEVPALRLVGTAAWPGGRRPAGRGPASRGRRRLTRRVAVAAGIAAAAVGAVAFVPTLGDEPAASAAAVEILESAAVRAAHEPAWAPGPDQFLYTRGIERVTVEGEGDDGEYARAWVTSTRETWRSVDARHEGLATGVTEAGQDPWDPDGGPWETRLEPCDGTWSDCADIPAFPAGMPTDGDADAMLAFLRDVVAPDEQVAGQPTGHPDQAVFDAAVALLQAGGMPPEVEAGLLGAVALIPGVTDAGEVTDVAGRSGVGVGLTSTAGTRVDIVIDPATDEVLGTVSLMEGDPEPTGWALLESGVVDAVGDLP